MPSLKIVGSVSTSTTSTTTMSTTVARAIVEPDGSIEARLIPAFIENPGQPVLNGEPDCCPGR